MARIKGMTISKVTTALLDRLNRREMSFTLAVDEYRNGRAKGLKWARKNIFPDGHTAPITADEADSPYNVGVIQGIAEALRRYADRLDPARKRSDR